jgi:hypothetical protein
MAMHWSPPEDMALRMPQRFMYRSVSVPSPAGREAIM